MFRNCLASALRHLARNRLYTFISVAGLAVGLCVALIAALVIRNQYTFDHDIPGYERTYVSMVAISPIGMAKQYVPVTLFPLAAQLTLQVPQVEAASMVREQGGMDITHAGVTVHNEWIYWADRSLPRVLPLPLYAGNLTAALSRPDGLVLSRSYARKFFGRDTPLGETLVIRGHPMTVLAVIQDRPPNATNTAWDIIASGSSGAAPDSAKQADAYRKSGSPPICDGSTYVRLRSGADPAVLTRFLSSLMAVTPRAPQWSVEFARIDRLNAHEGLHRGFHTRMLMLGVLGTVVLLIAAINFINLQTACSALRAREVAVRGLSGAGRGALILQFLGEALLYSIFAALLAIAFTEWLLPRADAFLDAGAVLDYRLEPWLPVVLAGATLIIGIFAGAWPAFVLSSFRPVAVLRGSGGIPGGPAVRRGLVILQFALLIGLAICSGVVYRQRHFALHDALRMDHDQVLMIYAPMGGAFADQVRGLPGVRALTRASLPFLGTSVPGQPRAVSVTTGKTRTGKDVSTDMTGVDFDLFDFYGIRPLAGHLPKIGADRITNPGYVVLNETAARRYELGTPVEAVGRTVPLGAPTPTAPGEPTQLMVLAVVPDFSLNSISEAVHPTAYSQNQDPNSLDVLNVRLTGHDIPETLAAIDAQWRITGHPRSLMRFFLDEQMQKTYRDVQRESETFGLCALIALGMSCIGLFALTAAIAERRTREIGIRKALGADTRDVLKLLLWQFGQPVAWANLIAWPVAGYIMSRWLAGFAYHANLPLWMFPAAAMAALMIALVTVLSHALSIARARPVVALRYE
jgi:putative ABC transport system permease protein